MRARCILLVSALWLACTSLMGCAHKDANKGNGTPVTDDSRSRALTSSAGEWLLVSVEPEAAGKPPVAGVDIFRLPNGTLAKARILPTNTLAGWLDAVKQQQDEWARESGDDGRMMNNRAALLLGTASRLRPEDVTPEINKKLNDVALLAHKKLNDQRAAALGAARSELSRLAATTLRADEAAIVGRNRVVEKILSKNPQLVTKAHVTVASYRPSESQTTTHPEVRLNRSEVTEFTHDLVRQQNKAQEADEQAQRVVARAVNLVSQNKPEAARQLLTSKTDLIDQAYHRYQLSARSILAIQIPRNLHADQAIRAKLLRGLYAQSAEIMSRFYRCWQRYIKTGQQRCVAAAMDLMPKQMQHEKETEQLMSAFKASSGLP